MGGGGTVALVLAAYGMDVVDAIAAVKTDYNDRPQPEQKMKSVTVDTQGVEYPEPEKLPDPFHS